MPLNVPEKFLAQIQLAWLDAATHVKEHGGPVELTIKVFRQHDQAPLETVIASRLVMFRSSA